MAPACVVPAFQEFEEGHARLGLGAKGAPVDELTLEGGEETFRHRVVKAVPGRAGRGNDPHLVTSFAKGERSVLRSPVGMMYDLLGSAPCQGHVQHVEHQLGAQMIRHRPSHHPAAEHIEHDGQIQQSCPVGT